MIELLVRYAVLLTTTNPGLRPGIGLEPDLAGLGCWGEAKPSATRWSSAYSTSGGGQASPRGWR